MQTSPILKVLLVLVAATGIIGFALAGNIWDPAWNPFRPAPEQVLGLMIQNSKEVATNRYEGNLTARIAKTNTGDELLSMLVDFEGDVDLSTQDEKKTQGTMSIALQTEGVNYTMKIAYRGIGNATYFKMDTVPFLPFLFQGESVEKLKNQWFEYKAPEKTAEQQQSENAINAAWKEVIEDSSLYSIEELIDERIQGKAAYHYRATLKQEALAKFLAVVFTVPGLEMLGNKEVANEYASKIGDVVGEVWVGKSDKLAHRYFVHKDLDVEQLLPSYLLGASEAPMTLSLEFDTQLSNYGKDVVIEAPENTKSFDEFLKETPFGALEEARQNARDAKRQADIRQISVAMELCYANSECGGGQYLATRGGPNAVKAIEPFMSSVPTDPTNDSPYQYTWVTNYSLGTVNDYCLYARLEEDSQISGRFVYIAAGPGGVRKRDMVNSTAFSLTNCE